MKNLIFCCSFLLIISLSCSTNRAEQTEQTDDAEKMYFPPLTGNEWQTKSVASMGWNAAKVPELLEYLQQKNTKSFMILQNGRIVIEEYFDGHTTTSPWYWASAGKTLTSTVVGIAAQQGFININNPVSDYIGTGWTNEPRAKESLITCRHLLTMTSGLDDSRGDDVSPQNLWYKADAGTRWAYHNVYVKLQDVVSQATGKTWDDYFSSELKNKIGMTGMWITSGNNVVYWSTTRSMARFGLLALNSGTWDGNSIVNAGYFKEATNSSQNINLSYGYLWWLNGKTSFHLPQTQIEFPGPIIPSAPQDMYCALGKNDQKIYVVPSKKLVVIRMGNAADNENPALSDFDDVLWQKINALIK